MKAKHVLTIAVLTGVLGGSLFLTTQQTQAFWPFDKPETDSVAQESLPHRHMKGFHRMHRAEHREDLSEFLELSLDQINERLQNGETIDEIAQSLGKNIEDFRAQQQEKRAEQLHEMGFSDEEISQHQAFMQKMHEWMQQNRPG